MDKDLQKLINELLDEVSENIASHSDYIGSISYTDVVNGEAVWDFRSISHDKTDTNTMLRWKYSRKHNTVIWSNEFSSQDRHLVDNWLEKRGIQNSKHVLYSTFYSNHPELMDLNENDLPISGEDKYFKQEPGGVMSSCNVTTLAKESNFRIYNDTLCPDLWDQYKHLDGRIRVSLLRIAYDFYEKTEFKAPIIDVHLMGSIANYNWTPESDADVHIIIDFNKLQVPEDTGKEMVKTASSKWNDEHEVTIKNHKVEVNIQNVKENKPYVTGIYSLLHDKWVRQPMRQNISVDKQKIQFQYSQMKKYLESVIRSGVRDIMKNAKKYLDSYRQYGLDTVGELSVENIVFKILRSKGIIKHLKDSIVASYDKEMSISETIEQPDKEHPNIKSENFEIRFGEPGVGKGTGKIFLGNDPIAFVIYLSKEWAGRLGEGWVLNNIYSPKLKGKFPISDRSFKTLEDLLSYMEDWYKTSFLSEAFMTKIPKSPYLIVGVTDAKGDTTSGITYGNDGHASLLSSWPKVPPFLKWRYKGKSGVLYLDIDKCDVTDADSSVVNYQIDNIKKYLKNKYKISPLDIEMDIHNYLAHGHSVTETNCNESNGERLYYGGPSNNYEYFNYRAAVGVCIIFNDDDDESQYIFSIGDKVYLNNEEIPNLYHGDTDKMTHYRLENILLQNGIRLEQTENDIYSGRTWQIDDKAFISFWEDKLDESKIPNLFKIIKNIVFKQTGIKDDTRIWVQIDDGKFVTFDDVINGRASIQSSISYDELRKLHLMNAQQKKDALDKLGVVPKISKDPDFIKKSMLGVDEITQKNINSRHPQSRDQWNPDGTPKMELMTLDNLKAMREKAARFYKGAKKNEDTETMTKSLDDFKTFDDEIKRRIQLINHPITESIANSFEVNYGRGDIYVEVFKNPTDKELKSCKPNHEIGAILTDHDIYVWNREKAYHKDIMRKMNLRNDLSIIMVPDLNNTNRFDILVTDATKDTKWDHNPNTAKFIQRHPFFKGKQIDHIMYWDEDIVGDWEELNENFIKENDVTHNAMEAFKFAMKSATDIILNNPKTCMYGGGRPNKRRAIDAYDINCGLCEEWAETVSNIYKERTGKDDVEVVSPMNITGKEEDECGHVFVRFKNAFYDAECSGGVKDWRNLPLIKKSSDIHESYNPDYTVLYLFDCRIAGQPGDNSFTIYEFFSRKPNQGNAEKALSELKRQYGKLVVTDIGYPGDPSYEFWKYMLKKGIMDEVHDDQGTMHTSASTMKERKQLHTSLKENESKLPIIKWLRRGITLKTVNNEGYGAGIPETDRLHIKGERWRIRSKDAPKTPKISDFVDEFIEQLLMESPKLETLKKNRRTLTSDERSIVMNADATWHHGPKGEKCPAVWKSVVDGKTWYVTNTHRAYQVKPTIKGAIRAYHDFIKSTA